MLWFSEADAPGHVYNEGRFSVTAGLSLSETIIILKSKHARM